MNAPQPGSSGATPNGQSPPNQLPGRPGGPPVGYRPPARKPPPPKNPLAATQSTRRLAANRKTVPPTQQGPNGQQVRPSQPPQPPTEEYEEIPIITTKRSLIEGMRHHILRFHPSGASNEQIVNLFDESQFERPIRLHRRDPRINHLGHIDDPEVGEDQKATGKVIDDKEREKQEALKAERKAEREAEQALIAPTSKSQKPKKDKPRREQYQPQSYSDNVNKQKNMAIRYEEKVPWHIEDFENKQTWWGAYENHLSETHVAMIESKDQNGRKIYQMLPMQKWYKFQRKNTYKTLAFKDADAAMDKGARDPLWIRKLQIQEHNAKRNKQQLDAWKVFSRKDVKGEQGSRMKLEDDEEPEAAVDADDIDYNAEEDFADDEEGPALVGKDEEDDAKEVQQRMKKEQLEANIFEIKDQKDWDAEEAEEKRKRKAAKKHRKRMRRALQEREKNFDFDEESDEGDSSDDSEDSEIERLKEEEKRLEEERKLGESKAGKEKLAAPAPPPVRTGTPNPARPAKPDDPRRKVLKRAGSPGLSDASGNESSSRKKMKQKHGPSGLASNGSTISRPGSPANSTVSSGCNVVAPAPLRPGMKPNLDAQARQVSPIRGGNGSDMEMSDGGSMRQKKKKGSSNVVSPRGSRPGSPDGAQAAKKAPAPVDIDTLKASIPTGGISMSAFVQLPAIKPFTKNGALISMLRAHSDFDPVKKMVYPKDTLRARASPATT